jgi:hypothetical protein
MIARPADYYLVWMSIADLAGSDVSIVLLTHDALTSRSELTNALRGLAQCIIIKV